MLESPNPDRHAELLMKYVVPNMGDYTAVGGELPSILDRLDKNKALSPADKKFIRDKGLFDLCEFVKRLEATKKQDFQYLRARLARSPQRQKMLWAKYDIDFVDRAHMRQMMEILDRVEAGLRVTDADMLWLVTNEYRSHKLRRAIHGIEAKYFQEVFEKTNDPWAAVNASSNFRKAESPAEALTILNRVEISSQPDAHLQSALCTTKGGAKRDQRQYDEALHLGMQAHNFDERSFHPCTLVGAIHFETGDFDLGEKWFEMAVQRGATRDSLDSEVRAILRRLNKDQRRKFADHLLDLDPVRYGWAAPKKAGKRRVKRDV
jgi:tetratricopeptide (TPR) repeat protein